MTQDNKKLRKNLEIETYNNRDNAFPGKSKQKERDRGSVNTRKTRNDILISIIVPVYQEEFILDKVLKVYNEMLKNKYSMELIVSDGGSTDNTLNIAEEYADKIALHKRDDRQSIAEGRNNGAELAAGQVLVFINGDTIPANPEEFFDYIYKWANMNDSETDAYACPVNVFPEEELTKDKIFYRLHNSYVRFLNFIGLGMGRGECQIIKKDIFEQAGRYNNEIIAGEDFDLYRRISSIGKIKYEKKLMVYESPRRFRKCGYIKTIFNWLVNAVSVMFYGRSISRDWEAIR